MAGRPRKPDVVKQLQGTLQKCRALDLSKENMNGLSILDDVKPPVWLTKNAKRIFKEKASQLMSIKVLTPVDIDLLSIYSNSYAIIVEAVNDIATRGAVIEINTDKGSLVVANPYSKIYNDNVKIVNQIASQFGFSPSSRSSILALAQRREKTKDDFDDFE